MYAILKGREISDEDDERSTAGAESLFKAPDPINYNPLVPIETFDIVITDEANRSDLQPVGGSGSSTSSIP